MQETFAGRDELCVMVYIARAQCLISAFVPTVVSRGAVMHASDRIYNPPQTTSIGLDLKVRLTSEHPLLHSSESTSVQ